MSNQALSVVKSLKDNDQDFEWYPTTQEMIDVIRTSIRTDYTSHSVHDRDKEYPEHIKILDCGAGDGRLLSGLAGISSTLYAIEKSPILMGRMPAEVIPIGTDFHTATLIMSKVDIVVSNPPYSEYAQWATKIIKEATAKYIYLIIPARWVDNANINNAIDTRKARANVIFEGDFLNADRAARAVVNIVRITLASEYRYESDRPFVDAFEVWFSETFPPKHVPEKGWAQREAERKTINDTVQHKMVSGKSLIESLVEMYNYDMQRIQNTYSTLCGIDASVLGEIEVSFSNIKKALLERLTNTKSMYWNRFFDTYSTIQERLTYASRKEIIDRIHENVSMEFTAENAYAITLWVIRNANKNFDKQFIELHDTLVTQANIVNYKSNQRTMKDQRWKYTYDNRMRRRVCSTDNLSHYALDYRIVLENEGGLSTSSYSYDNDRYNGLSERGYHLINDILAVARTLGWDSGDTAMHYASGIPRGWTSGSNQVFTTKGDTNTNKMLMTAKAFKNGNMHIKFNTRFMLAFNIELGRLRGWVKTPSDAVDELKDVFDRFAKDSKETPVTPNEYVAMFNSLCPITHAAANVLLLTDKVNVSQYSPRPRTRPRNLNPIV